MERKLLLNTVRGDGHVTTKEHIQKTVVEGIVCSFRDLGIRLGDSCVYTSYLTRDLLKEKYNLDSALVAGELCFFPKLPLIYRWNPPYEFHMWVKMNNDIIDIAAAFIKERDEFKPNGKYYNYKKVFIDIVWEQVPLDGRIYKEIESGVNQIEAPIDDDVYIKLYNHASSLIDNWNR